MTDASILNEDEQFRVRLEQDPCREQPDWDCQGDIYYVEWNNNDQALVTVANAEPGSLGLQAEIGGAYRRFDIDHEMVGRYLRMFHDLVSFDYLPWGRGTLLFAVTRAQAEQWGVTAESTTQRWYDGQGFGREIPAPEVDVTIVDPDDEFGSPAYDGPADQVHSRFAPGTYRATSGQVAVVSPLQPELTSQAKSTWSQWIEGDVWGYIIEENIAYVRMDAALRGDLDERFPDLVRWEQVDALWGLYGQEYAEKEALSAFTAFTETETVQ